MLWYKSWLDTRSRFLVGLVLLVLSACGAVFYYPQVLKLMPVASTIEASGELGRRIREGVELASNYRGYVWSQLMRQSMTNLATLFAVLLGSGGLFSRASGDAALFTLSMPASRNRVLGVRAATGLAELVALTVIPLLLLPLLSPGVGQRYSPVDALAHGACLFVAAATFFSLALLLSTVFTDLWRPLLLACGVAIALSLYETALRGQSSYGIFRLMSGEDYFRTGRLPWLGLFSSVTASVAMLYAATRTITRQDF
jgi:ABC-2 type transport system permease protein